MGQQVFGDGRGVGVFAVCAGQMRGVAYRGGVGGGLHAVLDDRFQACRKGAGCDYRYELAPGNCGGRQQSFAQLVRNICDSPEKEYSSAESYNACVENVRGWAESGCGNIDATQMSGPVLDLSPTYR